MPAQSPDDAADGLDELAEAPLSTSNDQGSETERGADDIIKLRQQAKLERTAKDTNGRGGAKSGWRLLRPAKFIPPGSV